MVSCFNLKEFLNLEYNIILLNNKDLLILEKINNIPYIEYTKETKKTIKKLWSNLEKTYYNNNFLREYSDKLRDIRAEKLRDIRAGKLNINNK